MQVSASARQILLGASAGFQVGELLLQFRDEVPRLAAGIFIEVVLIAMEQIDGLGDYGFAALLDLQRHQVLTAHRLDLLVCQIVCQSSPPASGDF